MPIFHLRFRDNPHPLEQIDAPFPPGSEDPIWHFRLIRPIFKNSRLYLYDNVADGRTTYHSIIALYRASRGKRKKLKRKSQWVVGPKCCRIVQFCERQSWEKLPLVLWRSYTIHSALLRVLLHAETLSNKRLAWRLTNDCNDFKKPPKRHTTCFHISTSSGSRITQFRTDMATPVAQLRSTHRFSVVVANISRESTLY